MAPPAGAGTDTPEGYHDVSAPEPKPLEKKLGLLDVYAVATGATLSAGFFLLPGIAFAQAGPAMVLCYMLAAVPLVPAAFSITELATAMPRAGGVYYFLDRSMGPLVGIIGGFGTWMALVLKVAFALIGMGAYIVLFFPALPILPVAVAIALALGVLNLLSAEKSGRFQVFLVAGLLSILGFFIAKEIPGVDLAHFGGFFDAGGGTIISTAGLVYISYVGVTKVASLSEEVRDPERNLPRGIFLSLATSVAVYLLGTFVLVGVLSASELAGDLTPIASAAEKMSGSFGKILVSVAALLAFVSVANAGTLSASRYPLAMSRDRFLPRSLQRTNRKGIPTAAVLVTVGAIIAILLLFDVTRIAKLASAFQLLMFALVCLAVIVMRESKIEAYDPGYKSPFYPYMQIFGIVVPVFLIVEMGWLPTAFSALLVLIGAMWYFRVAGTLERGGAILHVFERLGQLRHEGLETELRTILKEKGLREEDPFDEIVARSLALDFRGPVTFENVVRKAAPWISRHVAMTPAELEGQILGGERLGSTPVSGNVALPHFRTDEIENAQLVLARGRQGISLTWIPEGKHAEKRETVHAVFLLVSPKDDPTQHLRLLAQIARHVEDKDFEKDWLAAVDEQELKEVLLREERWLSLFVHRGAKTEALIGKALREIRMPEGSLVVMLRRGDRIIVPRGRTILEENDRLTIIGDPEAIEETHDRYFGEPTEAKSEEVESPN